MKDTPNLTMYADLNFVEAYATRFGLDPDYVWETKAHDDVMIWVEKWQRQREYDEQYEMTERMMTESKA